MHTRYNRNKQHNVHIKGTQHMTSTKQTQGRHIHIPGTLVRYVDNVYLKVYISYTCMMHTKTYMHKVHT